MSTETPTQTTESTESTDETPDDGVSMAFRLSRNDAVRLAEALAAESIHDELEGYAALVPVGEELRDAIVESVKESNGSPTVVIRIPDQLSVFTAYGRLRDATNGREVPESLETVAQIARRNWKESSKGRAVGRTADGSIIRADDVNTDFL